MRGLSRLHIDGFVHLVDVTITFGPGLNVVHGPNEAGKSTLLRFVRYVLYGPPRRLADRGEPLVGTRHGGTVWLGPEPLVVHRTGRELTVTSGGLPEPVSALDDRLGPFDQSAFDAVFACDLDDLRQMGALESDELRRRLFASSVLGTAVDVERVERRWHRRRRDLHRQSRNGVIYALERSLAEARAELRSARDQAGGLPDLMARLTELDREIAVLEAHGRLPDLEALERRVESARAVTEQTVTEGGSELDDLGTLEAAVAEAQCALAESRRDAGACPAPGPALALEHRVEALEQAHARAREDRDTLARLARRRNAIDARLVQLASRWSTLAQGDAEALRALRHDLERWQADQATRTAALDALDDELARARRRLDSRPPVAVTDTPAEAVAWADRRAAVAERAEAVERSQARAEQLLASLTATLNHARPGLDREVLASWVAVPWRQVAALAEQASASTAGRDRAFADIPLPSSGATTPLLRRRASALAAHLRGRHTRARFALRTGLVLLFLLVVSVGVLALLEGLAERATAIVLVAAVLGVVALLVEQVRDATRQSARAVRDTLAGLSAHLTGVRGLDGVSAGELVTLARQAPGWLTGLRDLEALESDVAAGREDLARWVERGAAVAAMLDATEPATVPDALRLAERVGERREAARRAAVAEETRRREQADIESVIAELEARRRALAAEDPREVALRARMITLGGEGLAPADWSDWLADSLDARALEGQRDDVVRDEAPVRERVGREEAQIADSLARAEVSTIEGLHGAVAEAVRRASEQAARAEAVSSREASLQRARVALDTARLRTRRHRLHQAARAELDEARAALDAAKGSWTAWRSRDLPEDVDPNDASTTAVARDRRVEERGALKQTIDELSASARVVEAADRVAQLEAQLREARLELAEIELASRWLRRTWEHYVRETQPAVLQRASELLRQATDGAMTGVRERERQLFVESPGGRARAPEQLSRGSRELLYLVIRLALALEHSERTVLPLLLDDVLVNQDPERARQLARVLQSVSQHHQVIVLTCRPETRDLLVATEPRANIVEFLPEGSSTAG